MRKIAFVIIAVAAAQIACVWWLFYAAMTSPVVQKIGNKIEKEVIEWSETK